VGGKVPQSIGSLPRRHNNFVNVLIATKDADQEKEKDHAHEVKDCGDRRCSGNGVGLAGVRSIV
jgi:hypothetical protein